MRTIILSLLIPVLFINCSDKEQAGSERDEQLRGAITAFICQDKSLNKSVDTLSILSVGRLTEDVYYTHYRRWAKGRYDTQKSLFDIKNLDLALKKDMYGANSAEAIATAAERDNVIQEMRDLQALLDRTDAAHNTATHNIPGGYIVVVYASISRNGESTGQGELTYLVSKDMVVSPYLEKDLPKTIENK